MRTIARLIVVIALACTFVGARAADKPTPEQCKTDPARAGCQK